MTVTLECRELTTEDKEWCFTTLKWITKHHKYGGVFKKDGEIILIVSPKEGQNLVDEEGRPQAFLMFITPVGKRLKQYWMDPVLLKQLYTYIYNDLGYYDTMTYLPKTNIARSKSLCDWYEKYGMLWRDTAVGDLEVMEVRMNKDQCKFL